MTPGYQANLSEESFRENLEKAEGLYEVRGDYTKELSGPVLGRGGIRGDVGGFEYQFFEKCATHQQIEFYDDLCKSHSLKFAVTYMAHICGVLQSWRDTYKSIKGLLGSYQEFVVCVEKNLQTDIDDVEGLARYLITNPRERNEHYSDLIESFRLFVLRAEEQLEYPYGDEVDVPEGYDVTRFEDLDREQLEATFSRIKKLLFLFESLGPQIEKDLIDCSLLL